MQVKLIFTLWLGLMLGTLACGNDDGGPIPDAPMNNTDATFGAIYDNILSQMRCASAGCHGAAGQGNLRFDMGADAAFTALMASSANSNATQSERVVPNDPAASWFYLKVTDETVPGGRMPPGGMLTEGEMQAIEDWINNGAPRSSCSVQANFDSIHDNLLSQSRCANDGCHGTNGSGGLRLDEGVEAAFTALMQSSVNTQATQPNRVVANAANQSWFYLKLSDPDVPGGLMPLGQSQIPTCEIEAVETWINNGATR